MRFTQITNEVAAEAERSIAKHGEQRHLPMGTGPDTTPLAARPVEVGSMHEAGLWPGMRAPQLARIATLDTKSHSANEGGDDTCTWWHILREEVLEAAAEDDAAGLRAELVQVAAVAIKMIDALGGDQAVNPHRIEVELSSTGDVSARMTCTAADGAPCRMHCDVCEEYLEEDHATHELRDQGYCLKIEGWFDASVFECYDGPTAPLRSDEVVFGWNGDWMTWSYAPTADAAAAEALS